MEVALLDDVFLGNEALKIGDLSLDPLLSFQDRQFFFVLLVLLKSSGKSFVLKLQLKLIQRTLP